MRNASSMKNEVEIPLYKNEEFVLYACCYFMLVLKIIVHGESFR